MNIYEFASDSPVSAIIIVWLIVRALGRAFYEVCRHISLMKLGYPPEHCDADGDPIEINVDNPPN